MPLKGKPASVCPMLQVMSFIAMPIIMELQKRHEGNSMFLSNAEIDWVRKLVRTIYDQVDLPDLSAAYGQKGQSCLRR